MKSEINDFVGEKTERENERGEDKLQHNVSLAAQAPSLQMDISE